MSDRNSKQDRIDEILAKAWDLPPNEIESYLNEACAGDAEVRHEVERLLKADQQSGGILEEPPIPGIANDLKDALEDAVESDNEIKAAAADRNLLFGIVALQMNFIKCMNTIDCNVGTVISSNVLTFECFTSSHKTTH